MASAHEGNVMKVRVLSPRVGAPGSVFDADPAVVNVGALVKASLVEPVDDPAPLADDELEDDDSELEDDDADEEVSDDGSTGTD